MSKKEHRNHVLYSIIAPRLLQIFSEELNDAGRPMFSKCRITPDGAYLDIFIQRTHEPRELVKQMSHYASDIQRIIANAKVLSRMPKVRFRVDPGSTNTESVLDILDDLRAKYDLS
jgi:ribosome-binding factor A